MTHHYLRSLLVTLVTLALFALLATDDPVVSDAMTRCIAAIFCGYVFLQFFGSARRLVIQAIDWLGF